MSADNHSCGSSSCGCADSTPSATPGEAKASILDQLGDDEGFHPMGSGWEGEMEEMLDDTEYDTELGMQMARDAMRLVAGEISEEDFYAEYHDAVVEEFETDERPMAELFAEEEGNDNGGHVSRLPGFGDDDVSRRDTMKKMGLGAGALALTGLFPGGDDDGGSTTESPGSAVAAQTDGDVEEAQYGMVIDLERCDGCLECVIGCMNENHTSSGANWMYVLTWQDETTDENNFLVRPCQHCSNPPCAKVCPVNARHRRVDGGFVLTNYETCIGCRYCQVACPYGVNYFEWGVPEVPREDLHSVDYSGRELRNMSEEERRETLEGSDDHIYDHRGWEVDSRGRKGTMGKCTFCPSRQDGHATPEHLEMKGLTREAELHEGRDDLVGTVACMDACDAAGMSAIHFGRLDEEDSRPNRYLEMRKEMEQSPIDKEENLDDAEAAWADLGLEGDFRPNAPHGVSQLSAFRLLEEMGTEPNIIYLGNEPGATAEQVPPDEAPVQYDRLSSYDGRSIADQRKDVTDEWTDLGAMGR